MTARERLLDDMRRSEMFGTRAEPLADAAISEAVATTLAELRTAVHGLFGQFHPMCFVEDEPTRHDVVSRKAVLALIDKAGQA